jgi:hypothetical protein
MSTPAPLRYAGAEFEVRQDAGAPAFFLFGVRKSGSSIANSMAASLAKMNGVNYVDVAGRLFERGVSVAAWQNDPGLGALLHGGNLYAGFRNAPSGIAGHPMVRGSRQALLVRDPRDALVSEYFSNAFSHSIPEEGEARAMMMAERSRALKAEIGPYVRRMAPRMRDTLREYLPFMDNPGMRIYRYESAILDKRWFMQDLCEHFGWQVSAQQLSLILGWADVMPAEENPTEFVRRVTPGDHLEKLDAETIAALDAVLAEELRRFGYAAA